MSLSNREQGASTQKRSAGMPRCCLEPAPGGASCVWISSILKLGPSPYLVRTLTFCHVLLLQISSLRQDRWCSGVGVCL